MGVYDYIRALEKLTEDYYSSDMEMDEYVATVQRLTAQIKGSLPVERN